MDIVRISMALAVVLTGSGVWASPVIWPIGEGGNGYAYEAIWVPGGITWGDAAADALARGGYLATILSAEEDNFVFGLVKNDERFWIADMFNAAGPWLGGRQAHGSTEPAGGWEWVTREPWNYDNWGNGEPCNLGGNENSLHYFDKGIQHVPAWNDLPEDYLMSGYILETPEPATVLLVVVGAGAMLLRRRGFARGGIRPPRPGI